MARRHPVFFLQRAFLHSRPCAGYKSFLRRFNKSASIALGGVPRAGGHEQEAADSARHAVGAIAASIALLALPMGYARPAETPLSGSDIARSFETQIARLDALDPRSPDALEAHLRYAGYLTQVQGPSCGERLSAAQAQLESARRNVALAVILPQGLAQAADVDYRIQTALASCGDASDTARRDAELHAALASAQRAAELYRDTFDYPAMLTMQFNAACTYRSLGNYNTCVEIVLRAVPDATDLKYALREMQHALHLRHGENFSAWTTTYLRLITDPATLQAHHRDVRQFFYGMIDGRPGGAFARRRPVVDRLGPADAGSQLR